MNKKQKANEKALVLQAKQGSQSAFKELVEQNANYVFNLALRLVKNQQEAEDLSQEAFVRIWKALPKYRVESQFRTWLYRIVVNLCYDRLPNLHQELSSIEVDKVVGLNSGSEYQPETALLNHEMKTELHKVIDNMPQGYRLLITLRHLQGLSYKEISEITGQPIGTLKSGIHRARKILRERIVLYEIQP